MKKKPEQTRLTRQNLLNAFWSLYETKELDKITIGEITRLAEYNRGTFYVYFTDIYDMLTQLEDELLEQIQTSMRQTFAEGLPDDIAEYSIRCATVFKKYDDRLFLLLGPKGDPKFQPKLQHVFFSTVTELANISLTIPHFEYVMSFIFSSLVGLMTLWYERNKDLTEEEFIGLAQKLVVCGILGYSNLPLFNKNPS